MTVQIVDVLITCLPATTTLEWAIQIGVIIALLVSGEYVL